MYDRNARKKAIKEYTEQTSDVSDKSLIMGKETHRFSLT